MFMQTIVPLFNHGLTFQAYNIYKFLRKAIMDEYERNTQQLIESNKRYYDASEECEWLKQRLFVNPSDSILGTYY